MSGLDLIVRNGMVVSPDATIQADVAVEEGKIIAIGRLNGFPSAREEIDAQGKYVIPGAIDVHVHFRDPGMTYKEDWRSGSAAAAAGGVTTVFDMPNTHPPTSTLSALQQKRQAAQQSHVDFGIYGVLDESSLDHIDALVEGGVIGFKCFMSESTGDLPTPDDGVILEGLESLGRLGVRCSFHAENAAILMRRRERLKAAGRVDAHAHVESRPEICEVEAVSRAILLAEWSAARLQIAHKSSKAGLRLIQDAKRRGVDITAETCPHYLLLDARDVARLGGQLRINPPIREPGHSEGLWAGLIDGTIDMIATDHAPHDPQEKLHENIWDCARGIPGVETQMPLMLTEVVQGRMTLNDYVRWSATNPAKAWDIFPTKGILAAGSDADMAIVDMTHRGSIDQARLHSRHKYTPWHGRPVAGRPIHTIVRGRVVMRDGVLVGAPGWGRDVADAIDRRAGLVRQTKAS